MPGSEIRMILEAPINPQSILCIAFLPRKLKKTAERPIFAYKINAKVERRTHPQSKRLKTSQN